MSNGIVRHMKHQVLVAARLDARGASVPTLLITGRALRPDGFHVLQTPPCSLSAYAAARVRHALARDPDVSDAEVLECATSYSAQPEFELPPDLGRLSRMMARAGALCPNGAALGVVWVRSFDNAMERVLPRAPHPFLREAMRAETKRVRSTWGQRAKTTQQN